MAAKKKKSTKKGKKKSSKKKGRKKGSAVARGFAKRKPTGDLSTPKRTRKRKPKQITAPEKGGKKKRRRKGAGKRKTFSTNMAVGRTKAKVITPIGDTLVATATARKTRPTAENPRGRKVTELHVESHMGRIVHMPRVVVRG